MLLREPEKTHDKLTNDLFYLEFMKMLNTHFIELFKSFTVFKNS